MTFCTCGFDPTVFVLYTCSSVCTLFSIDACCASHSNVIGTALNPPHTCQTFERSQPSSTSAAWEHLQLCAKPFKYINAGVRGHVRVTKRQCLTDRKVFLLSRSEMIIYSWFKGFYLASIWSHSFSSFRSHLRLKNSTRCVPSYLRLVQKWRETLWDAI